MRNLCSRTRFYRGGVTTDGDLGILSMTHSYISSSCRKPPSKVWFFFFFPFILISVEYLVSSWPLVDMVFWFGRFLMAEKVIVIIQMPSMMPGIKFIKREALWLRLDVSPF